MGFELKKYKLAEIADVQTGPFGSQLHKDDYVPHGTPIITVEHLGENFIIHENTPKVSNDDALRLSKYSLCEGDIVFSRVGSVDRRAYVSKKEHGWLFSGRCLRVRVNKKDKIDPKYLSYYFGLESFREYVRSIAVGATMPSLNTKIMSSLEIQAPELNVQVAISKLLSSLDKKIELNNAINKNLEEMAQALFKRWFVDFEFPNENGEPYKSSGGEFEESELGLIPKGWRVTVLSNIISVKDGTHDSPKTTSIGYRLITTKHLKGNSIDFSSANLISEEDYNKINQRSKVDRFDILISMIGTVGNLYLVQDEKIDFAIKNVGLFKTSERLDLFEYIYLHLKTDYITSYIAERLAGSTQQYISLSELRKIPIIIPQKRIISEFKQIVGCLISSIYNNERENRYLESIRDNLLPKLMSGEIRVPVEQDHSVPDLPMVAESSAIYQP